MEYLQLEFMYTRNQTTYSQHNFITGLYSFAYDSNIDQYQFGILVSLPGAAVTTGSGNSLPISPTGLGFTHESNDNGIPNRTDFAFNLGGGAKYFLTKHFGLRGDLRYMPTYAEYHPGLCLQLLRKLLLCSLV